jgi:hypothetical protein
MTDELEGLRLEAEMADPFTFPCGKKSKSKYCKPRFTRITPSLQRKMNGERWKEGRPGLFDSHSTVTLEIMRLTEGTTQGA